jgi:MFS superfamily sulfate permease-like transporter
VHAVVIDASAITDIDCTAAQSLRDLLDEMARRNVMMVFGRVSSYLKSDLDRHGITAAVGAARIFPTLHEAITVARGGPISRTR